MPVRPEILEMPAEREIQVQMEMLAAVEFPVVMVVVEETPVRLVHHHPVV